MSCTVSKILVFTTQKLRGHVILNTPKYCRILTCIWQYCLQSICIPNLKCLASSTPKRWPGHRNVEMGHIILTTGIWGTVSHQKAHFTCSTRVQNLKSVALAVKEIFQGCKTIKRFVVAMGHPRSSPMSQFNKAYSTLIETVSLLYYFSDIASWAYLSKFADPTCIWHPIQGDPGRISWSSLAPEN